MFKREFMAQTVNQTGDFKVLSFDEVILAQLSSSHKSQMILVGNMSMSLWKDFLYFIVILFGLSLYICIIIFNLISF